MEKTPSDQDSKDENQLTTFSRDILVEVDSPKLFKSPTYFKKLSICFAILAILFFIIMVIFIILYSKHEPEICTSQECIRTASDYLSSMNFSVNPCDNFYEFVCGRWSEQHPNHGWSSSFGSFASIGEKISIDSMNILNKEINQNEPEAVKKMKRFYQSCLDVETADKLGIAAIYPFLKKTNLPIVPNFMTIGNKSNVKFNWMLTDALAKQIFNRNIFIGKEVGPNIFNGSQNVLKIGKIIHNQRYKDNDTVQELKRNANINIIMYVMNKIILNKTGQEAAKDLLKGATDIIIEMSDFIDEIGENATDPDEQEEDKYGLTVENLQNQINGYLKKPNYIFLTIYLGYLFNSTNVEINTKSDLVYVSKSDILFLKMIMEYLSELPDVNIELYAWWKIVFYMADDTSSAISDYIRKQLNSFSANFRSIATPKSLECTSRIRENMYYAISYTLASSSFENVTKPKVSNMMLDIKEAFLSSVKDYPWIDNKTKNSIVEKANEMITFIGYPQWLFEKGELNKYYENIIIKPGTFLRNTISFATFYATQELNSLKEIRKRAVWEGNPVYVNANHVPEKNAVEIYMAILNFPFYNLGLETLNYGAIGSILGHELIHGFDNKGRKYDKHGNIKPWWTNKTIKYFEKLTDCFVKQFENFKLPGIKEHVNGKRTLGENIADSGGIHQSFKAYTNYISEYGKELKLPDFENYNNYQLFFIAYANVWCRTTNPQDLKEQLLDEHSPNFIRVMGTLQNSEYFANTFKCPKGSPMNPVEKCKIW